MTMLKRRNLLLAATAMLVSSPTVADSKKAKFEYVPSKLGIDYRALAPSPLAEILSQGEAEWMQNAKVDYMEDTAGAWKEEMVPEIATGAISKFTIQEMRSYTPNMLTKFAAGLKPQDQKYGYLWSVGALFVSEKFAGKS